MQLAIANYSYTTLTSTKNRILTHQALTELPSMGLPHGRTGGGKNPNRNLPNHKCRTSILRRACWSGGGGGAEANHPSARWQRGGRGAARGTWEHCGERSETALRHLWFRDRPDAVPRRSTIPASAAPQFPRRRHRQRRRPISSPPPTEGREIGEVVGIWILDSRMFGELGETGRLGIEDRGGETERRFGKKKSTDRSIKLSDSKISKNNEPPNWRSLATRVRDQLGHRSKKGN